MVACAILVALSSFSGSFAALPWSSHQQLFSPVFISLDDDIALFKGLQLLRTSSVFSSTPVSNLEAAFEKGTYCSWDTTAPPVLHQWV